MEPTLKLHFNPTVSRENTVLGGTQDIYKFENGRGASVIRGRWTYGGDQGLYELAVLDADGDLDYTTPITDDVIGYLTEEGVQDILARIAAL